MNLLKKLLILFGLAAGSILIPTPDLASANIGPAAYTDCNQSASFGNRVCIEKNGPYGFPWVIGYSNATTIAFASTATFNTSPYTGLTPGGYEIPAPCQGSLPIASLVANRPSAADPNGLLYAVAGNALPAPLSWLKASGPGIPPIVSLAIVTSTTRTLCGGATEQNTYVVSSVAAQANSAMLSSNSWELIIAE